jgi:Protein of unknown function (DUF2510)
MAVDQAQEWLSDPAGRHRFRLYSDGRPTEWVSDGRAIAEDPLTPVPAAHPTGGTASNSYPSVESPAPGETAVPTAPDRPAGWYRNASDPDEVRYWDGSQWATDHTTDQSTDQGAVAAAPSPTPTGSADRPPVQSSPETDLAGASAGTSPSAVPADWYPDPSNRTRLRFWDGAGWTEHVLDEAPAYRPAPADPSGWPVNGAG